MIGTIRISQLPPADALDGSENIIVNQSSNTKLSSVESIVGLVTYAPFSGISTVSEGITGTPDIIVGIATASSFVGDLTGTATTATNLENAANISTGTINSDRLSGFYDINVSYASTSGISTVSEGITGTPDIIVGIATASSFVGDLTGTATTATNLENAANISTGTINSDRLSGFYDINVSYASTSGISTVAENLTGFPEIEVSSLSVSGVSTLGTVEISSGIVTATSGIVTYYGDGGQLQNVISGIQSSGFALGSDITTLNFIGAGNTFAVDGTTLDISIESGSSQWSEATLGISTSSFVGIGTTNPVHPLQVGAAGTDVFVVTGIGSVGIGTINPTTKLHVNGDINLDDGGTFTTTIQVVTPTANRVISYPDATGTLGLVAGSSGQVTYNSAGIQSGGNLNYDSSTGTFGYGAGRGTVTQATNKSTGVTLNAPCGAITMNSAGISSDTTVSFTLTNSSINTTDLLILNHISGGTAGAYTLNAQAAAGSASINVRNITDASLSEAIVIGFAVIKT